MPKLKQIVDYFEKEYQTNIISGRIVNGEIPNNKTIKFLSFIKKEGKQMVFNNNGNPLRIESKKDSQLSQNNTNNNAFNHFFWCSKPINGQLDIQFLPCGNGLKHKSILDIGFGDKILFSFKGKKVKDVSIDLAKEFIFTSNTSKLIFIQTFPGDKDKSFRLHGLKKQADIIVEDDKWIVSKIINSKPFSRKYKKFLELNIVSNEDIQFVEASKAKEAWEAIKEEESKGNTLLELWKLYSEIEFGKKSSLKSDLGTLTFHKIRNKSKGIVEISLDCDDKIKEIIKENKAELSNTSFELITSPPEEDATAKNQTFKLNKIDINGDADIYDPLNLLPDAGEIRLSILGDEIANKRRQRALKALRENVTIITRNLLFAIEGKADAMIDKKRRNKAMTDKTRAYMKANFGIDRLTPNQREAVEIAINTPDIAIIQGPPGTGKSTVVAAVCHRLIEIAEKEKKSIKNKLILVSAYQNDTVEHIASKIRTWGLPTLKIGKETQGNIRSEDIFVQNMIESIDAKYEQLRSKNTIPQLSKKLSVLKDLYTKENNINFIINELSVLSLENELDDNNLLATWRDILKSIRKTHKNDKKIKILIKSLRINKTAYDDDGLLHVQKLLRYQPTILTNDEIKFLDEEAPLNAPTIDFLAQLKLIKEKYITQIYQEQITVSSGQHLYLTSWLEDTIKYFLKKEQVSYENEDIFWAAHLERIKTELEGSTDYIKETIKKYSEGIASTNQIAGGREMSLVGGIENVLLEEAARSNPLDLLIPMSKATERIIMVGDQKQLPHILDHAIAEETSNSSKALFEKEDTINKLKEALFGVIFKNLELGSKRKRSITLTEQFRMHPFIGDFISKVYYQGKLKSGLANQAELKQHKLNIPWAKDKVAIFCDVPKDQGIEARGRSKYRNAEAKRIVRLLDELFNDPNFKNMTVGIITFYSRQVEEIFREAKRYVSKNREGGYSIKKAYELTQSGKEKLRIGSVDSFQGKEFDIVILSTVRSNKEKRTDDNHRRVFGFLKLESRLNVAFSRCQKLLIVAGDGDMFSDSYAEKHVKGLHEFFTQISKDKNYGNQIR